MLADSDDRGPAPPDHGALPSRHPRLGRHHAHDGWLFVGRRGGVQFTDGRLRGWGAGAGVLIPGFGPDVEWFTTIWGDQDDNLRALHLDESVTGPLPRVPHPGIGPVGVYVDGVREFRLDESIARAAGLEMVTDEFVDSPAVRRVVEVHDDCYWSIRPVDDVVIRQTMRQLLALHEEYLDDVGGFGAHVESLSELVASGERLTLKTSPYGELRATFGPRRWFRRRSRRWRLTLPAADS